MPNKRSIQHAWYQHNSSLSTAMAFGFLLQQFSCKWLLQVTTPRSTAAGGAAVSEVIEVICVWLKWSAKTRWSTTDTTGSCKAMLFPDPLNPWFSHRNSVKGLTSSTTPQHPHHQFPAQWSRRALESARSTRNQSGFNPSQKWLLYWNHHRRWHENQAAQLKPSSKAGLHGQWWHETLGVEARHTGAQTLQKPKASRNFWPVDSVPRWLSRSLSFSHTPTR